jgi:hypothetical protein
MSSWQFFERYFVILLYVKGCYFSDVQNSERYKRFERFSKRNVQRKNFSLRSVNETFSGKKKFRRLNETLNVTNLFRGRLVRLTPLVVRLA